MASVRSKNSVFVRNLDSNTSDNDFVSYFQTNYGGVVEGAKIIRDKNGRSKGYGFISFIDRSIVDAVISKKNHIIGGTKVVCKIVSPKTKSQCVPKNNEIPQHLREVYICNLDADLTMRQLKDYFSYFGAIENIYIISDEKNRPLGYGFVEFENSSSVDSVQELRPHNINDKEIQTVRVYPKNVPRNLKQPTNVLYISNYDECVDENDIEDYFTEFGNITLVSRKIQRPQDVKFMEIQFDDYDAVDVVCLANNHTINGCTITVSKYLESTFDKSSNSTSTQSNSSISNFLPQPDFHHFTSHPDLIITQQPSSAFLKKQTNSPLTEPVQVQPVPSAQGFYHASYSSQYEPQRNDDDDDSCCGSSQQREPERNENDNESCVIL